MLPREPRKHRAPLLQGACLHHRSLHLAQLRTNQKPVPESLQHVIDQSLTAIQKAQLNNIPEEKICERRNLKRNSVVDTLLQKSLDLRLPCSRFARQRNRNFKET